MAGNLPVHISPNNLKNHPEFSSLLDDLGTNVLVHGTSRDLHERMIKVQQASDRAKVNYAKALLMYTELYNLLSLPPTQNDYFSRRILEDVELQYIAPMLGVDYASLRNEEEIENEKQKVGTQLCNYLEGILSKKCASLVEFYEPNQSIGGTTGLQVAKGVQFAQVIATRMAKLDAEEHQLILDSVSNTLNFWEYYHVLEKVLWVLSTLITTQKEQAHEENLTFTKWLQERLQTTQLKLQVLGCQFRESIYTKATTSSLRVIGHHLETATVQAKQQYDKTVSKQQQYEAIGLGFSDFAHEYTTLVKECTNKEWALQELQQIDNK